MKSTHAFQSPALSFCAALNLDARKSTTATTRGNLMEIRFIIRRIRVEGRKRAESAQTLRTGNNLGEYFSAKSSNLPASAQLAPAQREGVFN